MMQLCGNLWGLKWHNIVYMCVCVYITHWIVSSYFEYTDCNNTMPFNLRFLWFRALTVAQSRCWMAPWSMKSSREQPEPKISPWRPCLSWLKRPCAVLSTWETCKCWIVFCIHSCFVYSVVSQRVLQIFFLSVMFELQHLNQNGRKTLDSWFVTTFVGNDSRTPVQRVHIVINQEFTILESMYL